MTATAAEPTSGAAVLGWLQSFRPRGVSPIKSLASAPAFEPCHAAALGYRAAADSVIKSYTPRLRRKVWWRV